MIRDIPTVGYGDQFTGKQIYLLLPDRHITFLREKGVWVGDGEDISYNQGSIKLVSILGDDIDKACNLLRYSRHQVTIEDVDGVSVFCRVDYRVYYDSVMYGITTLRNYGDVYFAPLAKELKQNISVINWNRYGGYTLEMGDYPHYNVLFGHGIKNGDGARRIASVFGIPLSLSQSRSYYPSTKGVGKRVKNLVCADSGEVFAEYTEGTLYVLFCPQVTDKNIPELLSGICGQMVASISGDKDYLIKVQKILKEQARVAQEAAKVKFIQRLKDVPEEKLKELKAEEVHQQENLNSYYVEVNKIEKRLKAAILAYELYFAHYKDKDDGGEVQLAEFFELMENSTDISKIKFTDCGIDVYTDHIFITYEDTDYLVGKIIIHIDVEDNVINFSRDPADTPHVKGGRDLKRFHPHANRNGWNGTCWGNIGALTNRLLRGGDFVQLIHLIMVFLRSCTRGSGYTNYLQYMYTREELVEQGITLG